MFGGAGVLLASIGLTMMANEPAHARDGRAIAPATAPILRDVLGRGWLTSFGNVARQHARRRDSALLLTSPPTR
jgi:hypothetical protein